MTRPGPARARSWTVFRVHVVAARMLSAHLARVSLADDPAAGGASLRHFADNGYDQRVKLILPADGGDLAGLTDGADWYVRLRALPDAIRPVVRTYTVRAIRGAGTEGARVDVDMVCHGGLGPGAAWAGRVLDAFARPGGPDPAGLFEVALLGPDARFDGWHGGLEFVADAVEDLLFVGDETAVPAIAAILERLPDDATGAALIEVGEAGDRLDLVAPAGIAVHWLPRDDRDGGAPMTEAALRWRPAAAARGRVGGAAASSVADPLGWDDLAWEVPAPQGRRVRAWVAGEASAVRTIRRHLIGPCGLDRSEVAFMGYWRRGRAEE